MNYESGEDMWYMRWTLDGLCIGCRWTLHTNFEYTLDNVVYTILVEAFLVN